MSHFNQSSTASNRVPSLIKGCVILTFTLNISAHNIDSESFYEHSFASVPYDLTAPVQVAYNQVEEAWDVDLSGTDILQSSATTSRAVFAHLERDEVDIYTALIDPADHNDHEDWLEALVRGGQTPGLAEVMVENHLSAVIASPLPPACANTKNDYPSIALAIPTLLATGPKFPSDSFSMSCVTNESVPGYTPRPGHCVVSIQHNIESASRVVFNEPHTGASWFLPTGCILSGEGKPICDGDYNQDGTPEAPPAPGIFAFLPNSLPAAVFPGLSNGYEIEIVVWSPSGKAMDYTLNSGIREDINGAGKDYSVIAHDHELEEAIANNNWINNFQGGCGPVSPHSEVVAAKTTIAAPQVPAEQSFLQEHGLFIGVATGIFATLICILCTCASQREFIKHSRTVADSVDSQVAGSMKMKEVSQMTNHSLFAPDDSNVTSKMFHKPSPTSSNTSSQSFNSRD